MVRAWIPCLVLVAGCSEEEPTGPAGNTPSQADTDVPTGPDTDTDTDTDDGGPGYDWATPTGGPDPDTWYGGAVVSYDVDWAGSPSETLVGWASFWEAVDNVASGAYGYPAPDSCSTLERIEGAPALVHIEVGDAVQFTLDGQQASVPLGDGSYHPVELPVDVPWGEPEAVRAAAPGDDLPPFDIGTQPFPATPMKVLAPPMANASIRLDELVFEWEPGTPAEDVHITLASVYGTESMICTAADDGSFRVPAAALEERFPDLPDSLRVFVNRGGTSYHEVGPDVFVGLTAITRTYGVIDLLPREL